VGRITRISAGEGPWRSRSGILSRQGKKGGTCGRSGHDHGTENGPPALTRGTRRPHFTKKPRLDYSSSFVAPQTARKKWVRCRPLGNSPIKYFSCWASDSQALIHFVAKVKNRDSAAGGKRPLHHFVPYTLGQYLLGLDLHAEKKRHISLSRRRKFQETAPERLKGFLLALPFQGSHVLASQKTGRLKRPRGRYKMPPPLRPPAHIYRPLSSQANFFFSVWSGFSVWSRKNALRREAGAPNSHFPVRRTFGPFPRYTAVI